MPKNDNIIGISFEADVSNLKKGLDEAKKSIQLTNSEFQNSTAGLQNWQKTSEGLNAKIRQLTTNISQQEKVVSNLKEAYALAGEQYGFNSEEAKKLLTEINKQEATYKRMNTQLTNYQSKLKDLTKVSKSFTTELENTNEVAQKAKTEFEDVTKTMVDWRSNADGLTAKIKQLNTVLPEQQKLVATLEREYAELTSQQDYSEESAKQIQDEWKKQNKTLNSLKNELNKYSGELKYLKGSTDQAEKENEELKQSFDELKNEVGGGLKTAFKGLVTTMVAYAGSLAGVAESTREYRQDLSKLQTNADSANVSLKDSKKVLKDLNAITGETDSNIEALSNLMMAGFKDNQLEQAVETLSDAVIKFPDTLKVESLADSLQESIQQMKLGNNATGQYAELLERLGYNLDDVKEKVEKLNTDDEKRAYLLDLVNKKIGGTSKAYRDQNKALVEASDAQFDLNDAMSELGAKAEPSISTVKKGVADMIKELVKWADENVDVEDTTESLTNIITSLGKDVIPIFVKGVQGIVKIFDDYYPLVMGLGTAYLTYNTAVKTATILTQGASVATSAYTTIMGLFKTATITATTATTAQTVAQTGLNTAIKLNPIGLAISLVTALGVGLFSLSQKTEANTETQKTATDVTKENIKVIKEEIQARQNLMIEQEKQMQANLSEMDNVASLNSELKTLVDSNGKVKEGYESRVRFILNEISNATGVEVSLIDGQIQSYKKLQEEIDNTILKKKAEIILTSQEEAYTNALNNRTKAIDELRIYQDELTASENELREATEKYNQVIADPYATELDKTYSYQRMSNATAEYSAKEKQYNDQNKLVKGYFDDIATYEENATLLASQNAEDWKKVIDSVAQSYVDGETKIELSLTEQIKNQQLAVEANKKLLDQDVLNGKNANDSKYKNQVEAGERRLKELANELVAQTSTINQNSPDVVEAWKSMATNSEKTFTEIIKDLDPELQKVIENMVYTVDTDGDGVKDSFEKVAEDSVKKVSSKKGKFEGATKDLVKSAKTGVETNSFLATGATKILADDMVDELEGSSTGAETAGKNFVKGAKKGVDNKEEQDGLWASVTSLGSKIVSWFNDAVGNHSPSHLAREALVNFLKGGELGIDDEENSLLKQVKSAGRNVVNAFNKELSGSMAELKANVQATAKVSSSFGSFGGVPQQTVVNNYSYNQYNNSPKALSEIEIYRQTHNLLGWGD